LCATRVAGFVLPISRAVANFYGGGEMGTRADENSLNYLK
jgi:hypothetical protein